MMKNNLIDDLSKNIICFIYVLFVNAFIYSLFTKYQFYPAGSYLFFGYIFLVMPLLNSILIRNFFNELTSISLIKLTLIYSFTFILYALFWYLIFYFNKENFSKSNFVAGLLILTILFIVPFTISILILKIKILNYWKIFFVYYLNIFTFFIVLFVIPPCYHCRPPTNRDKSYAEKANIRNIDTQIELYQVNTGLYPTFPNMDEMFLSASYFPDGFPKDPFTGNQGLGVYSLDNSSFTGDWSVNATLRMRTNTFMHFCSDDQTCGGFKPKGHKFTP